MYLLVYLRRHYCSPLPPTALLRRLQHAVLPRPAGLLWWLGIRRLSCWGEVRPATSTFLARMPWGHSDGPVIRGRWQEADATTLPLAETLVRLTIRPMLTQLVGGCFMLAFLLAVSLLTVSFFAAGIAGTFGFIFITDSWWSIRRAERHFQTALALEQLVAKPA